MKRIFALVIALSFAGCDTSEPQDYVPRYDPNNQEPIAQIEFCPLLARETCAILRPCCQASPYAFDENKCRVNARALCESRKTRSLNLLAPHALRYDDFMAGRCVHGSAALVRGCMFASTSDDPDADAVAYACGMVWHGDRGRGDSCDLKKLDCAPIPDRRVTCSGACIASKIAGGGDDCRPGTETVCAKGLVCRLFGGDTYRCTAQYHALGTPCRNDSECGNPVTTDVYCDHESSPTSGTCRTLPRENERCASVDGRSASDRRCARGFKCDTDVSSDGVCTPGKPVGATCTDNGDCASGTCVVALGICFPGTLADPAICNGGLVNGFGGLTPVVAPQAD